MDSSRTDLSAPAWTQRRPRFLVSASRGLALVALTLVPAMAFSACGDSSGPPAPFDAGVSQRDGASIEAAPPPPPRPQDASGASCERYCALVSGSCKGKFAQYTDMNQCMVMCATLPAGNATDRTENTVGCRQTYAGNVAKTDPARYCPVAGPFGGGVCGERCDAFCAVALAVCARPPWPTLPACVSACTNLRYVDTGEGSGEGLAGPTNGDTFNCRTRQLFDALTVPEQCEALGAGGVCAEKSPPQRDD